MKQKSWRGLAWIRCFSKIFFTDFSQFGYLWIEYKSTWKSLNKVLMFVIIHLKWRHIEIQLHANGRIVRHTHKPTTDRQQITYESQLFYSGKQSSDHRMCIRQTFQETNAQKCKRNIISWQMANPNTSSLRFYDIFFQTFFMPKVTRSSIWIVKMFIDNKLVTFSYQIRFRRLWKRLKLFFIRSSQPIKKRSICVSSQIISGYKKIFLKIFFLLFQKRYEKITMALKSI